MPDPLTFGAWLIWHLPYLAGAATFVALSVWMFWRYELGPTRDLHRRMGE